MALTSTLIKVRIQLSDVDRGLYPTFELRLAQHPSEEGERVILRLLALCLLHEEELAFGRGLSSTEEPALWVKHPGDTVAFWVEVGKPAAARLHKASKRAERVAVVTDRDRQLLKRTWQGESVHRSEVLEVLLLPPDLVREAAAHLGRSIDWTITSMDGQLTIVDGETVITGEFERTTLADIVA